MEDSSTDKSIEREKTEDQVELSFPTDIIKAYHENNQQDKEDDENTISLFSDMQCEESNEDIDSERCFRCEICIIWYNDIEDFFEHIFKEHQHIEISNDMQDILYKQWENILSIEKTIMELVSKTKYKSAKRHLKSSLVTLNSVVTNVFSVNDNIFKYFISTMRPRLKTFIKESKILNSDEVNRQFPKKTMEKIKNFETKPIKLKRAKKRKKMFFVTNGNVDNSSDFSSDDNICLKEAIKRIKKDPAIEENVRLGTETENGCLKKIAYYVVPEKDTGVELNFFEKDQIRIAVRDLLKKRFVNMDLFNNILLRRFELEFDEVVPDNAFIINGWMFPGNNESVWEKMSFQEFFLKNSSSKHKKRKVKHGILNPCSVVLENIQLDNVILNKLKNTDSSTDEDLKKPSNGILPLDVKENVIKCNICQSVFISHHYLNLHKINIHHVSDFPCDTCGEIFLYKDELSRHELQHKPLSLECEVNITKCDAKEELKKRSDFAKSRNSLSCDICSERFFNESELKKHRRVKHAEVKSMEETKTIEINNKLNGKVVKYDKNSSNAPECEKCLRKFTSIGRLTQHIAIAHEGKVFLKKKKNTSEEFIDVKLLNVKMRIDT